MTYSGLILSKFLSPLLMITHQTIREHSLILSLLKGPAPPPPTGRKYPTGHFASGIGLPADHLQLQPMYKLVWKEVERN